MVTCTATTWRAITAVTVGDALAAGAWAIDLDFEARRVVELDGYPGDLTQTEQSIVSPCFGGFGGGAFRPVAEGPPPSVGNDAALRRAADPGQRRRSRLPQRPAEPRTPRPSLRHRLSVTTRTGSDTAEGRKGKRAMPPQRTLVTGSHLMRFVIVNR